jgi:SAM-dependent methyltransferase
MNTRESDQTFTPALPAVYESHLVPLVFAPYAAELADRLAARPLSRVLEVAAGTGIVTRKMAMALPERVDIVATDRNQPMLDMAMAVGTSRPVEWRQADAMQLPFADGTFDAVVCGFGVMFFPDKGRAFSEARRVLGPGGVLIFSVWDRLEQNEFADTVTTSLSSLYPDDPPRFLARVPHGYTDPSAIAHDLGRGGFERSPQIETVPARSRAASPRIPAMGYCQGTPLRDEIESRGRSGEATVVAAEALAERFGAGEVDGKIQAHIVTVER